MPVLNPDMMSAIASTLFKSRVMDEPDSVTPAMKFALSSKEALKSLDQHLSTIKDIFLDSSERGYGGGTAYGNEIESIRYKKLIGNSVTSLTISDIERHHATFIESICEAKKLQRLYDCWGSSNAARSILNSCRESLLEVHCSGKFYCKENPTLPNLQELFLTVDQYDFEECFCHTATQAPKLFLNVGTCWRNVSWEEFSEKFAECPVSDVVKHMELQTDMTKVDPKTVLSLIGKVAHRYSALHSFTLRNIATFFDFDIQDIEHCREELSSYTKLIEELGKELEAVDVCFSIHIDLCVDYYLNDKMQNSIIESLTGFEITSEPTSNFKIEKKIKLSSTKSLSCYMTIFEDDYSNDGVFHNDTDSDSGSNMISASDSDMDYSDFGDDGLTTSEDED